MRVKCHKCEMDTRVIYYSMRGKCYSTRVMWNFTREVHIYTLRETWSMLVLKRIVNFTIQIVGIKTTEYSINLFPKAINKNDKKSLAKQLIIKEIADNQLKINKYK